MKNIERLKMETRGIGTSCTVNAGGYVQLKAGLKSDTSVYSYKRIRIKSLI